MITRILTRTRNHGRMHTRLAAVVALALALVGGEVISEPPIVQSVSQSPVSVPTNLRVTTVTGTSIKLEWDGPIGSGPFTVYLVERSDSMSGPFRVQGPASGPKFTDTFASPSTHAYVYRVRKLGDGDLTSDPTNMAVGTTIAFPDQWDGQPITAQSINDVRTAINAVREVANLPEARWTRRTLGGLVILASDVKELRDRLDEALSVLKIPLPIYEDLIPRVTRIMASHIEELLSATRGSSYTSGPLYGKPSRAVAGEFGEVKSLPIVPIHLSVLPNGKILFWGRDLIVIDENNIKQVTGQSKAYVWDMVNPSVLVGNSTTNLFCSGHSFLPDGNLFVTGGHNSEDYDRAGDNRTNIFNYLDNTWTSGPTMNQGRWYPYNVTLGTGEPVVMAGDYWTNRLDPPASPTPTPIFEPNLVPQVYTPAPEGQLRNLAEPSEPKFTQYPYLHLRSDGTVFQVQSGFINPLDKSTLSQASRSLDPRANFELGIWTAHDSTLLPHAMGSAVLYGDDKIMVVGGFDDERKPTTGTEYIDFTVSQPKWTQSDPMSFPRAYHTATVLPDGKVLVTGGVGCTGSNNIESNDKAQPILDCSAGQIMIPELWDPVSKKWSKMAPHKEIRAYHSVAALLPDATVLVGGGGRPGAIGEIGLKGTPINRDDVTKFNGFPFGHANVEIFSPPYLFNADGSKATQPVLNWAPLSITYGETFFIGTSALGIAPKASLVRLPSVTHGFNQDQRIFFWDNPVLTSGGINVTAPTDSDKLPPGYYMLFVLNTAGVPSLARIVRVQNQHLFPNEMPATTASGQGLTWEQGVEFSSSVSGEVTHIRFWKALGEPSGGHVGNLWTADGVLLRSVTFGSETASGWQEAELIPHVPITPGVRYKVTYNLHSVGAKTFNVFCKPETNLCHPITRGPLVSWGSSFSTPRGSFPTTGSTSNLFADIRFKSPQQ